MEIKSFLQESAIRRELRERRQQNHSNIQQDIQPFKSFRKNKDIQQNYLLSDQSSPNINYNHNASKGGESVKHNRYKYDLNATPNQNQPFSLQYRQQKMLKEIKFVQQQTPINALETKFKFKSQLQNNSKRRKEVQSIIFDSKVTKVQNLHQPMKGLTLFEDSNYSKSIQIFQQKVDQVNTEIEEGLHRVQLMIKDLKKKRGSKKQIELKNKKIYNLSELEKQFSARRAQMKSSLDNTISENAPEQMSTQRVRKSQCKEILDSQIQLQGNFLNTNKPFPQQLVTFVNRLSNQVQMDSNFTSKITELHKSKNLNAIKCLIFSEVKTQGCILIDQSFFQIQPSQIDPLDQGQPSWFKTMSKQQLERESMKVYKMYKDIETHYQQKIFQKFCIKTIELFFEELSQFNYCKLGSNQQPIVTVGHFLSYLNMRTNKNFRNRSFVKMLKRLGLKAGDFLNLSTFSPWITKS